MSYIFVTITDLLEKDKENYKNNVENELKYVLYKILKIHLQYFTKMIQYLKN